MSVRRLLPHLGVLVAVVLQLALYRAWHLDDQELYTLSRSGSPNERVHALHVLTNRGTTPHTNRSWDRAYVTGLMNDPEPLVADYAYTVDICRMVQPAWQERRLARRLEQDDVETSPKGETFAEWLRHFLLYRRKVAGRHMGAMLRLKNDELRWLLDAIAGAEFDGKPILADIHQRQTYSNLSRTRRMAGPDRERKKRNAEAAREGAPQATVGGQLLPDDDDQDQ